MSHKLAQAALVRVETNQPFWSFCEPCYNHGRLRRDAKLQKFVNVMWFEWRTRHILIEVRSAFYSLQHSRGSQSPARGACQSGLRDSGFCSISIFVYIIVLILPYVLALTILSGPFGFHWNLIREGINVIVHPDVRDQHYLHSMLTKVSCRNKLGIHKISLQVLWRKRLS